jgi:ABC-type multidrug transport system fused ATPase/permease subunit
MDYRGKKIFCFIFEIRLKELHSDMNELLIEATDNSKTIQAFGRHDSNNEKNSVLTEEIIEVSTEEAFVVTAKKQIKNKIHKRDPTIDLSTCVE